MEQVIMVMEEYHNHLFQVMEVDIALSILKKKIIVIDIGTKK